MDDLTEALRTARLIQEQYSSMMEPWIKQREMVTHVLEPIVHVIDPMENFSLQIQDALNQRMKWAESLNIAAETLRPVKNLMEDQAGMIEALQSVAKTPELLGLQNQLISNNLFAAADYAKDIVSSWEAARSMADVFERSMAAQNIAFLRLTPDYQGLSLPRGGKKAVKGLSKSAAKKVTETDDILFDTKDGEYFHKNTPDTKVSAEEITVVESSLEIFEEIGFSELIEFESLLLNDMTFAYALENPVGATINKIIKGWTDFIDFDKETFFHARALGEDGQAYLDQDMLKAPKNVVGHGRYNPVGKACYYFAETMDGAVKEVRKHSGNKKPTIQVAEVRPCKSAKIIDLSKMVSKKNKFIEHMRYAVDTDEKHAIKPRYLLPNFVASCCQHYGIEGIKYLSGDYACYVTWNDDYFEFVDRMIVEPSS